jgi:hypothetical protein
MGKFVEVVLGGFAQVHKNKTAMPKNFSIFPNFENRIVQNCETQTTKNFATWLFLKYA